MTDSEPVRPGTSPAEPDASIRAELIGRLAGAGLALESAIAELRQAGGGPALDRASGQLGELVALQRLISAANPADLAGIRHQIAATVAASRASAQEAHDAANAHPGAAATLAEARADSRRTVQAVMDGMHDFDPYLQFASKQDEEEYRRHEAERRAYIEREQAKGTPQGDVNAAHAALDQLKDAGAHGADKSPQYQSRFDALSQTTDRLDNAVTANSQSRPAATSATQAKPEVAKDSPTDMNAAIAALHAAGVQTSAGHGHGVHKNDASRDVATSARV